MLPARVRTYIHDDPAKAESDLNDVPGAVAGPTIWSKLGKLLHADDPIGGFARFARNADGCLIVRMRGQRVVLLSDPRHFRQVLLTKVDQYAKYFDGLRPIFGESLITRDGKPWQRSRAVQQPAFHPDLFAGYLPSFLDAIEAKAAEWRDLDRRGESFEMVEHTWTLAAAMTSKALFDRDLPFDPYFVYRAVKTYTSVVNQATVNLRDVDGGLAEPTEADVAQAVASWAAMPPQVVAAPTNGVHPRNLMTMIQAAVADPKQPEFDLDQLHDEIKLHLWAGTETTALTLAWSLYLCTQHPEAIARIRAEAEDAFADRAPDYADYAKLAFTRNVIQEAMRLYPPAWALIRVAMAEDEFAGHKVEPGDKVIVNTYLVHHDPRFWDEPERFDPDRFTPERSKQRAMLTYLPFGSGKRVCIGGAMSQVENTFALALFLRRFDFEYLGPVPAPISPTVTLTPRHGLHFRVRPRG